MPVPLLFAKSPVPSTNQRKEADFDLKDLAKLRKHIDGYYYLLECIYNVFFHVGYHKTPGVMPSSVREATKEMVFEELADVVPEVLDSRVTEHDDPTDPLNFAKIRSAVMGHQNATSVFAGNVNARAVEIALSGLDTQKAVRVSRLAVFSGKFLRHA